MYKTPTFAEPQQCNRPFSTGQLSAFIIQLVTWLRFNVLFECICLGMILII
jgi:hypothetical protein